MKFHNDIMKRAVMAAALLCAAAFPVRGEEGFGEAEESPKHEMRGAWVASVYGIDWPSRSGDNAIVADAQRKELCEILDILKDAGMNAVMFQVRSMSDAMYRSSYEPWSAYLTGSRGTSPAKGWDPLAFAVEEAHKRGLELHAWVNPFRLANGAVPAPARAASGSRMFDPVAEGWVISYTRREQAPAQARRKGKNGKRTRKAPAAKGKTVSILDPGNPGARKHIVDVCREIIVNYDVDGLVFDDYFYPDRLPLGGGYDFDRWQTECVKGGKETMSQADWRRANVGKTIGAVSDMIARERPWVRFGVSPAGVGGGNGKATERHGLQPPAQGTDWMYDRIFCDPLDWLAAGSVDYVSPQIYWASNHATNPYPPIARWWEDVALHFGRHCFPSQKVLALPEGDDAWREQLSQVETNRRNSSGTDAGSIFYSTAHITGKKARGLGEFLRSSCYASPALMPPMPWKEAADPGAVKGVARRGSELTWQGQPGMRYVVYAVPHNVSPLDAIASSGANFMSCYMIGVTYGNTMPIPPECFRDHWFAIAPYDRFGNEWEATIMEK